MKYQRFTAAACSLGWLLAISSVAPAADLVRKLSSGQTVAGTFKSLSKNDVEIEKTVGGLEKIPVSDIDFVSFDGEPLTLRGARASVSNGFYENALTVLNKISPADANKPDVKADITFYKAYCLARLALGGGGKIVEAGQDLNKFVTSNPNNYHFYTATEMIADIQLKLANYDEAQKKYSELESAPFPEYKMRAGVGKGRVLVAEKKFSEAQSEFEKVRAITSVKGKAAEKQQFAAQLGIALCQANQGKVDEAIAMIEGVIKGVDPEDTDLMAQAYVTLGRCYLLKSDAKKQALLAFLHVDQLYSGQPAAHAEALKNLDILWRDLGKPERALQAVQMLKDRYSAAGP